MGATLPSTSLLILGCLPSVAATFSFGVEGGQSPSDSRSPQKGDSGPTGVAQGRTRQQASVGCAAIALQRALLLGRKTSRGDIIMGRPAISLTALPLTHDTISHLYGVDDGEALPVA
jgi:hypothetical protein